MKKYCLVIAVMLSFPLTACGRYTTARHSADFSPEAIKQGGIVIMPAEVESYMVGNLSKKERLYEYEDHLEDLIAQTLPEFLSKEGYRVVSFKRSDLHQRKLSAAVLQLRERYNQAISELYAKPVMPEKEAHNINKNLGSNLLTELQVAKYLLFCDFSTYSKTTASRVADLMIDVVMGGGNLSEKSEGEVMLLGIIDLKQGNIVWTNKGAAHHSLFEGVLQKKDDNQIDKTKIGLSLVNATYNELYKK
jgi:hypothetical protein